MASSNGDRRIRFLPLKYSSRDSEQSVLRLIFALRPEWESSGSAIEIVRFTDGITNTLLKVVNKAIGLSSDEVDREAILLRAYGHGTDLIIDRQREARNHELLMHFGLAPELLARFENGMMYRFIRGTVTRPEDLRRPDVSAAIARRLAEWHAVVPCIPQQAYENGVTVHKLINKAANGVRSNDIPDDEANCGARHDENAAPYRAADALVSGRLEPNIWSVMQKWIFALPTETDADKQRRAVLQKELLQLIADLSQRPGLGDNGLVFSHNDLLSGNVIMLPPKAGGQELVEVAFIDYEYAVPSPAAFDIANHFAEWGGFDCDMSVMPTVSQRRDFINEYMRSYARLCPSLARRPSHFDVPSEAEKLLREVDVFRGLPGFYWGIWALIQATISEIDFDYASYAETRLSEYWAWKAEISGERAALNSEMPLRERRWAQETD
ncbi:Protein kinase-like domain protein [Niveomyces insectorum RCEF 264]|uniref:ethanolamine kinase n=1 Tax=Niveomyces insectorum RCEF 264 TaxID=1081102 RepID=A0A167U0N2_9HYPO|nr:Protein kinase-like domain protein [Niveomyces insectorum RCEF 264]